MPSDLLKASSITNNIYVSGYFPLEERPQLLKELGIKYILSCVDRDQIASVHDAVLFANPDVTIMYLPYSDTIEQNLWMPNSNNQVQIVRYAPSTDTYAQLKQLMDLYQNKPMIEVGYHFMDRALKSNQKILVHCMAGISRSVSLTVYYLMKSRNMDYASAFSLVRKSRPIANPNYAFRLQLLEYQDKRERFNKNDADACVLKALQYKRARMLSKRPLVFE